MVVLIVLPKGVPKLLLYHKTFHIPNFLNSSQSLLFSDYPALILVRQSILITQLGKYSIYHL